MSVSVALSQKNRCRTTIPERMVETRAELPFIGDQVGLFRAQPGRPKRTCNPFMPLRRDRRRGQDRDSGGRASPQTRHHKAQREPGSFSGTQQKAMFLPSCIVIGTYDVPASVDPEAKSGATGGEVDRRELAIAQQKAMLTAIVEHQHDTDKTWL